MDEFEKWAAENVAPNRRYEALDLRTRNGSFMSQDAKELYATWLESARRADRKAREECRDVFRNLREDGLSREQINRNLLAGNPLGNTPGWQAGVNACIAAIIDTIEDSEGDTRKPA